MTTHTKQLVDDDKRLIDCAKSLSDRETFRANDLVKWKSGLKHKRLPLEGQTCIVIKTLESPIISEADDPGSPYFLEPLDIALGMIDEDGDFVIYYYDSSRFTVKSS